MIQCGVWKEELKHLLRSRDDIPSIRTKKFWDDTCQLSANHYLNYVASQFFAWYTMDANGKVFFRWGRGSRILLSQYCTYRQFGVTLQGPYQRPGAPGAVVPMSQPWSHISRSSWPRASPGHYQKFGGYTKRHPDIRRTPLVSPRPVGRNLRALPATRNQPRVINHAQSTTRSLPRRKSSPKVHVASA